MPNQFVKNAEDLWQETEQWKKTWQHKKPCREWKQNKKVYGNGYCKHYVDARFRKFKAQISTLFELPEK